ncbi:MAG: type VI secretion system baseplate subunit TssK [Bryobacteraceae bacterium]|nr:type VI secretion system baseplate subunit TssK [Bryobacteraceae bacterium]
MKNLQRVVWSEGMYLAPHHFQAQGRYLEDLAHFATSQLWFEPYGFNGLEVDADSLRNGVLSLIHARGVFPDGLVFHMPEYDSLPPPRALSDVFPALRESVDVSLSVPPRRPGSANCALNGEEPLDARYIAHSATFPDENTGRDEKPVRLGRKNVRFVLDTEDAGDAVMLRCARIRRDPAGRFVLDERFVPPSLEIGASGRLMTMVSRLVEVLEEKCRSVARPKDLGSPTASGFSAHGIANAWFLHCVNSAAGPLRHLGFAARVHPELLFIEMSRLAGALCTFSLESHPGDLPLYDHERLAEVFDALEQHIRGHLELVVPSNLVPIALEPAELYFWQGKVLDERTLHRSRWILGIHSPVGEAELIERTPRLVKVCSREFVGRLVDRALPGLKLSHLPVPPPAVSPKVEYHYFSIDKAGPCWDHIVKTREVGIYVPGELPDPELELSVILES